MRLYYYYYYFIVADGAIVKSATTNDFQNKLHYISTDRPIC